MNLTQHIKMDLTANSIMKVYDGSAWVSTADLGAVGVYLGSVYESL